jgi:hypothetical protein
MAVRKTKSAPKTSAKKAPKSTPKAAPKAAPKAGTPRRSVTPEAVERAIKMRESGSTWTEVIDATGFNGAILRPHMKRAGFDPEAVTPTGAATPKGIAKDRVRGVSWYALSQRHGITEAEARKRAAKGGCPEAALVGRVYLRAAKSSKKEVKAAK